MFLVIFLLQLAAIDHQRRIAKSQNAKVESLLDTTRTAEAAARPVLEDAREVAPSLERAGRAAAETLDAADPLIRDLVHSDTPGALRRVDALTSGLLEADAPGAVARGDALARELAGLLDDLTRMELLPTLRRLDLLPRLVDLLRRSVRVQVDALAVQRETLAILERSLAVQEETLVHVRSLDRKTGGPTAGRR